MQHIGDGIESARKALGVLSGKEIEASVVHNGEMELVEVPGLAGAPDRLVLASYVRFSGDFDGQVLILYHPEDASQLARVFAPKDFEGIKGDKVGNLVDSLVYEIANILTAAALNAIADRTESCLKPTPPWIVRDMAGAVIESVLASGHVLSEKVPVVRVNMKVDGSAEAGADMIFLPGT